MKSRYKLSFFVLILALLLPGCQRHPKFGISGNTATGIQGAEAGEGETVEGSPASSFRYVRSRKVCVNGEGVVGRNVNVLLECADFADEDWSKKDLKGQSLRNAKLSGINFFLADLSGADFSGADLRGSSFFKANLAGAIFDEDTQLSEDLSKEQVIHRGGVFKDYLKLDHELSEAILNGQFDVADQLLAQLAEPNESLFDFNRILNGPTRSILQYLVKKNIEVSSGPKDSKFLGLFNNLNLQTEDKVLLLLVSKDEIRILLERAIARGLDPQEIWSSAAASLSGQFIFLKDEKLHPEFLDLFLQLKEININQPTQIYTGSCKSVIADIPSIKAIDYILSKKYDLNSNSCFDSDLQKLAKDGDIEILRYLRTKGYNFQKIKDGRSIFFDELTLGDRGIFNNSEFDGFRKRAFNILIEFGMNQDEFLNKIPVSVDLMMAKFAQSFSDGPLSIESNRTLASSILQTFGMDHKTNSQGLNLIEMSSPQSLLWPDRLKKTVEFYLQMGVPLRSGPDSLLVNIVKSVFQDKEVSALEDLIGIYKRMNVPLSDGSEKQSLVFAAKNLNVLKALAANGFSLNVRDGKGGSLYWYFKDSQARAYLRESKVPFDVTEVVQGKLLLDALCERPNIGSSHCSYQEAQTLFSELKDSQTIDFSDVKTLQFLKSYILQNDNDLALYLQDLLVAQGTIKKMRFADCELNGHHLFIEDPKMSLFQSLRPRAYQNSKASARDNSMIFILDKQFFLTDFNTSIQELPGRFGIGAHIDKNEFAADIEIETQDFESVSLNGKKCVLLNQYPDELKTHFRFLYLMGDSSRQLFINLKDGLEGGYMWEESGLSKQPVRVSLTLSKDGIETIWPELKDHLMWDGIGIMDGRMSFMGNIALPKSVLSKPIVGDRFTFKIYNRESDKKSNEFTSVTGVSY